MILVAGKLFGGEFPVTIDGPLLYATDDFGAAFTTIQHTVEIPGDVAEIIAQRRRGGIPVAENQSLVALYARNFVQPPVRFAQPLRVGARFQRDVDQLAVNAVRPAVIRAGEGAGITAVGVADAHCAVATLVEKRFDAAVFLANHHNCILAHVGVKKITGFGDLAFVGEK